jgi:hypothetical protein
MARAFQATHLLGRPGDGSWLVPADAVVVAAKSRGDGKFMRGQPSSFRTGEKRPFPKFGISAAPGRKQTGRFRAQTAKRCPSVSMPHVGDARPMRTFATEF